MHVRSNLDNSIATTRAFFANGYLYQLQIVGSKLPINERGKLENLFNSFEFIGETILPEPKEENSAYKFGRYMGQIVAYCVIGIIVLLLVKLVWRRKKKGS